MIGNCCFSYFLLFLVIWGFAGYAYLVNSKRPDDDPDKKDFQFEAIFLAPITWPLFLVFYVLLFIIKALLYGVFLVLFTIALLVIRKPFFLVWLKKIALKVGNKLLVANTELIDLFLGGLIKRPQAG
jgi:hypothetical protein